MGLFTQNIVLRMSNANYVIEKIALPPIKKGKVELTVVPGVMALIGGVKYKGKEGPYIIAREELGSKRSETDAFLFPDKMFDSIQVSFFGGQYSLALSSLTAARARFSIVGTATVEISDYKELANFVNRSITKEDLVEEINTSVRAHLSNEVSAVANRFITPETTEVMLRGSLDSIAQDVVKNRKTVTHLLNMGLLLSGRAISMHLNSLDDADDRQRLIDDALTTKALESLDNDILDRQERERDKERQHEIDRIRAQHSESKEYTQNINTNGPGAAAFVDKETNGNNKQQPQKLFCMHCGKEITQKSAKFCPGCGKKL